MEDGRGHRARSLLRAHLPTHPSLGSGAACPSRAYECSIGVAPHTHPHPRIDRRTAPPHPRGALKPCRLMRHAPRPPHRGTGAGIRSSSATPSRPNLCPVLFFLDPAPGRTSTRRRRRWMCGRPPHRFSQVEYEERSRPSLKLGGFGGGAHARAQAGTTSAPAVLSARWQDG
ncbi:hypothetical protein B0H14DRAFT_690094 [Mycena olivaceomarginata]|nr:hypothetical protein B0H14DRAFT_690094 [Mycena olivaceomarginata]